MTYWGEGLKFHHEKGKQLYQNILVDNPHCTGYAQGRHNIESTNVERKG